MTTLPASGDPRVALLREDHGIAVVRLLSFRGASIPVSLALLRELETSIQEIEEDAARGEASLVLIQTEAPHPPLSGYDLEEIRALTSREIFDWSQEAQSILRRVERLSIPTVAVILGDWVGGAAELALACSHRVAAATPDACLVLPQTRRGLVPAWGGTVRLPRLIGLHGALGMVLSGEQIGARKALEIGLIDQLIPVAEFDERLRKFAIGLVAGDRRGSRRKRKMRRRLIEDTAPGRRLLAARAARKYLRDSSATLASPLALDLMIESSALPLAAAFDRESTVAGELIITSETRGRLHSERLAEQATRNPPTGPAEPDVAAVIGAGETGSDLAYLLLRGGGPVRIKDARDAARTGVARARRRIAWDVRQGHFDEDEGKRRSALVEGVSGFGGFGLLDVVMLAPDGTSERAEDLAADIEPHIRDDALIAFHDWTLSPAELETRLAHPDRLVGVSPAFPIDRFPLLEVMPGPATSAATVAEACQLARNAGLTPVVVREPTPSPGVRLLSVFLAESTRLLEAGASVEMVDAAIEEFGFTVGPFRRIDAIGAGRVARMLARVATKLCDRAKLGVSLAEVAARDGTFYRYRGGRPAGVSTDIPETVAKPGDGPSLEIRRRILLLLINEAVRILEEGCVARPADLDLISILALGFPRQHGGLLYYAQSQGLPAIVTDLRREASRIAPYFAPAERLERLAAQGAGFFVDPPVHSGHDSDAVLQ